MRTWSLEETVIRAQSAAAVVAQGVWDVFTHRPACANDHPIPGCPSPSDCRGFGCAGDCSEAVEAPTYDDEVSEPRPPGFYTMMDPEWADLHYGFPYPPADKEHHIASDGGEWVFNNLGGGEWDAVSYPPSGDPYMEVKRREREAAYEDEVPNPTEPSLSDDELVAVRGLIQERYDPTSSPAAGARAAGSSPSEVSGHSPRLPSEGCPDPSRGHRLASVRGEGGAPDSGIQQTPGAPQPQLDRAGLSVPAILEVLVEHNLKPAMFGQYYCELSDGTVCEGNWDYAWEWREHVAPIIADRVACDPARAIAALHNHKPQ